MLFRAILQGLALFPLLCAAVWAQHPQHAHGETDSEVHQTAAGPPIPVQQESSTPVRPKEVHAHEQGLRYTPNQGQWPDWIRYRLRMGAGDLLLEGNTLRYVWLDPEQVAGLHPEHGNYEKGIPINGHVYEVNFPGANSRPRIETEDAFTSTENFFLGKDPSRWARRVASYRQVIYRDLYDGIDLRLHQDEAGHPKYNFELEAGANPTQIALDYAGPDSMYVEDKRLHILTSVNEVIEAEPVAYQIIDGERIEVPCRYVLRGERQRVSFAFPEGYDRNQRLIIDPPVLVFSTFSGSTADNWGFTATFDSLGSLYSGGLVNNLAYSGTSFPVTPGAFQTTFGGGNNQNFTQSVYYASDMALIKYTPDGTQRDYMTYLGGSGNEQPHSMITNDAGELFILGTTRSNDFPMAAGAYDSGFNGGIDIVVSRLSSDGSSLLASTYLGGTSVDGINYRVDGNPLLNFYGDDARGEIILDDSGDVVVATSTLSANAPITSGAFDANFGGPQEGYLFRMDPGLSTLRWASFLGGGAYDAAYAMKINSKGDIVVVGGTESANFPVTGGTWQPARPGGSADGYVVILSGDGQSLKRGTFVGTAGYDQTYVVDVDDDDNVYFAGQTDGNYPVQNSLYSDPNSGQFITKLDSNLANVAYSTVFGSGNGQPDITLTAFLVDICGNIYVSGWGSPTLTDTPNGPPSGSTFGLPTTPDAFQSTTDGSDFYVIVLHEGADSLFFASFMGGNQAREHVDGGTSRFDRNGVIYQSVCAGCGGFDDFPTTSGAWSETNESDQNCNNANFKVEFDLLDIAEAEFDFSISTTQGCAPFEVDFTNQSQGGDDFVWFFGDSANTSSTSQNPTFTYTKPGIFDVKLVAENPGNCNFPDSVTKQVFVFDQNQPGFQTQSPPCQLSVDFTNTTQNGTTYQWDFGDGSTDTSLNPSHTYAAPGTYDVKLLVNPGTLCQDSITKQISVRESPGAAFDVQQQVCDPQISLQNQTQNGSNFRWFFGDGDSSTAADPTHTYGQTGTFTVQLIAGPGLPCPDTATTQVVIDTVSVASFSIQKPVCSDSAAFLNNSVNAQGQLWDFGDGTQSTDVSPAHVYADTGQFSVTLITNPSIGGACTDTLQQSLSIHPQARAGFLRVSGPCQSPIRLLNTSEQADSFAWSTNRGFQSSAGDVQIPAGPEGELVLELIAGVSATCPDTLRDTLTVNRPPEPSFEVDPLACDTALFPQNTSTGADSFLWQLRELPSRQLRAESNAVNPAIPLPDTGSFEILLRADPKGPCPVIAKDTVNVRFIPPSTFGAQPLDRCSREWQFVAPDSSLVYDWQFPDGSTSGAPETTFTFGADGNFQVELILADSAGLCRDTLEAGIAVDPDEPVAAFALPDSQCSERLQPLDQSSEVLAYEWQLSDGQGDTTASPQFDAPGPGTYELRLRTDPGTACADSARDTIRVLSNPSAAFEADQPSCQPKVEFRSTSTEADSLRWFFGDGTTATGSFATHAYDERGDKTIQLVATNAEGCRDTAMQDFDYDPDGLVPMFWPNVFTPNCDGLNDEFRFQGDENPCIDRLLIVDRWGRTVFETNRPTREFWQGNRNGAAAPEGVYVYKIFTSTGREISGTVTLIR